MCFFFWFTANGSCRAGPGTARGSGGAETQGFQPAVWRLATGQIKLSSGLAVPHPWFNCNAQVNAKLSHPEADGKEDNTGFFYYRTALEPFFGFPSLVAPG